MKVAIMQPYFLPYVGYFQLIREVDVFVLYDNIKYTKKGWINRNRYLLNGQDKPFALPLKKGSDYLEVRERTLTDDFDPEKLLNGIEAAYRKAPYFRSAMPVIQGVFRHEERNLFAYIRHALTRMCDYLGIDTPILPSSQIPADHSLVGEQRVMAICKTLGAQTYINPPGGRALYRTENFSRNGLHLKFIDPVLEPYPQLGSTFVPGLSVIDLIMNNDSEGIDNLLSKYFLSDS
ncbi:MAG: WbqC family protein [Alcanivoracaceae bacterium]